MTVAITIKNADAQGGRSIAMQVYDIATADYEKGEHINIGPPTILAPGEDRTVIIHSTRGVDITEV